MRAYSDNLRERTIIAVERGEYSIRQIAHVFSVSLSFVVRLLQRKQRTGSVRLQPHAGGPTPKRDAPAHARLLQLVREQPEATLAELRDSLATLCCFMNIARALRRHDVTCEKKPLFAQEQQSHRVQARRGELKKRLASVKASHLVFIDETGANTGMTRTTAA